DPFKVPEGEGERYRDDLARMMKSLRTTDLTVNIGRTPPVLRHLGAPDLPLVISRDTVRKATNGVKHVVPMDVIERLPELMHDPDAIYRSATERNAVVMLLDAMDKNGDPVVSAVHMKAVRSRLEINKVASVYGTEGGMNKANSLDKAGLTLYRKKKLSRDNLLHRGLQLPKGEHSYRGSVDKILYPEDIRKGPYYSRTSSLTPEETIASRFVRQMQDKFQVLKAVQENIRKTGGKIDDSNNAYMAEELFHGKAENDLNVMKERYVQPLAKLLADYKIAQADLDEYLYARHAPERNAHIAKINPKMPDGGSGMTNAEAAEIMQRVRNSGKQAQYDRLAGIIDDMLARRREIIREAGLEESGVVDAWQKAYRYYVPLKGQDVDGVVSLPRTGKGFTIGGRESKQAMGRASRAQSPSTQAIQDLSESLIRNRKNEVGNAFLKLVQDNPDKDYWQVFTDDKPDTMRAIAERVDPETGETRREVVERPVPMAMMADRYFTTKKDGKTYYIKLHDPRLMRAMKNMGPETSNAVIRTLGKVNRFLATVNTSYNPEFLVSNFIRDVQTAVMNLKAEQGRSDGKLKGLDNLSALAVVKDSRSAMSAVYASLRGKTLTGNGAQWQKVWKEFVEDGGKTGWFNMGDLEGQQKEMDRLVSLAKGGWKGQSIGAWNSFLNLVEDANGAVENALRLSAYKHARDAGLSRQQAASLAKNMTVNFNRRGEQGALMNSLYMFANASIQGTANLVRTLGHLNGDGPLLERLRWKNLNVPQKIALAAVGAGYLLGSLNRSVAGEDDDGVNWYDKVPDHVKERNLVIMKSMFGGKAGEYWSIHLPYGYNVFFLLGHTAEGVAAGDLTASRAAGNVVGGVLGAFSPIGSETSETLSGALLKNAAPTILRPFANLAMNENFMGSQIYQENMPFGTPKPDSQLGRRSTPEAYKAFASWLNAFSGGSQYRPGAVDITPESLKYWVDYISGGTGRFISKTTDAAVKSLNGIDIPEQQVPFLGKISGEVMPYADQQKMYDRMTEVAQYHAELKSLRGSERTAFIDENNGKLSMNGLMQDTRKRLKDLRKQRDAIYADSTLSLAQQSAMVKSVERDMKIAVDRFNREYNKKVGVE
ncbi:TPA: LPD38 domain-containing protein, partial [Escherichia coli]